MLNKTLSVGRLVTDPDLKYTKNGKAYCNFSLAVERSYQTKKKKDVDFLDFTAWNKVAENLAQYCVKGQRLFVEGELQTTLYKNQHGSTVKRFFILAKNIVYFDDKPKKKEPSTDHGFDDSELETF